MDRFLGGKVTTPTDGKSTLTKFNNPNTLKKQKIKTEARILFLYPNERGMCTIPSAIAILSQVLKNAGHKTSLFDTTFYMFDDEISLADSDETMTKALAYRPVHETEDGDDPYSKTTASAIADFRDLIQEFDPDFIAVSTTETTFLRALKLIEATRDLSIPNVFGGVFPTFAPALVMQHPVVDMVCVGEGENALLDLATCFATNQDYDETTNLWVRMKDGSIKKNTVTRPVDVNKMPATTDIGIFGEKRFYRPMGGRIRRLLPVETHRGCPYTCSFCNSPSQNQLYGGGLSYFRKKRIDLVKQEIENHIKEWKVEYIYFWADTFLAWSHKEFEEFCEMYSEIRLPFWCQTRIETINEYKLQKLKDVGLDRITFGMEHGNEEFRRRVVKRNYTNETAIRLMRIPSDLGIPCQVNNIIGFPDETRELAFDTIELNRQLGSDSVFCSIFTPFHGTDLRKYAEEKGYIAPNIICNTSNTDETLLNMPQWDREDIVNLRDVFSMYVKFPKERWPEIAEAETNPEVYARLSEEFIDLCWSNPNARIEDGLAEAAKGIF
jgi:anaerobic magnesium-protoporphyrin IX monomethyl ester cyclase